MTDAADPDWLAPPLDTMVRLADGRAGRIVSRQREPDHAVRLNVNGMVSGWIGIEEIIDMEAPPAAGGAEGNGAEAPE